LNKEYSLKKVFYRGSCLLPLLRKTIIQERISFEKACLT
jgi:hypothetical protein